MISLPPHSSLIFYSCRTFPFFRLPNNIYVSVDTNDNDHQDGYLHFADRNAFITFEIEKITNLCLLQQNRRRKLPRQHTHAIMLIIVKILSRLYASFVSRFILGSLNVLLLNIKVSCINSNTSNRKNLIAAVCNVS